MLSQMNLACVVVSPMRRALQTAYYLLHERPDFADILFILHPLCREHLHHAGDIPLSRTEAVEYAKNLFPKLDYETCFERYETGVGSLEYYA